MAADQLLHAFDDFEDDESGEKIGGESGDLWEEIGGESGDLWQQELIALLIFDQLRDIWMQLGLKIEFGQKLEILRFCEMQIGRTMQIGYE